MAARTVELAQEIVETLEPLGVDRGFTPERMAVPFHDITQIRTLKVVVFDGTRAKERITRGSYQYTYKPVVAVLKKLTATATDQLSEADELAQLVQDIEETLGDVTLADAAFDSFDEEQDADPYNLELLKSQGAYARAITLTFIAAE